MLLGSRSDRQGKCRSGVRDDPQTGAQFPICFYSWLETAKAGIPETFGKPQGEPLQGGLHSAWGGVKGFVGPTQSQGLR